MREGIIKSLPTEKKIPGPDEISAGVGTVHIHKWINIIYHINKLNE